jgi:hypothetical protein
MTSRDFVIWFRGFTEACNDFTATPKQWDRIKEVLYEVEDYDDNPGINIEIDDWYPKKALSELSTTASGSLTGSGSSSTFITTHGTTSNTVWNDKMGCWHYTNYPEGFGFFTNTTAESKKEKQQLND